MFPVIKKLCTVFFRVYSPRIPKQLAACTNSAFPHREEPGTKFSHAQNRTAPPKTIPVKSPQPVFVTNHGFRPERGISGLVFKFKVVGKHNIRKQSFIVANVSGEARYGIVAAHERKCL